MVTINKKINTSDFHIEYFNDFIMQLEIIDHILHFLSLT